MDARFPLTSTRRTDFGPRQAAHRITCGKCRATDEVIITRASKTLPDEMVAKRFRADGWVVGRRPDDDRCPGCAGTKHTTPKPMKEVLPMIVTPKAEAVARPSASPRPRVLSEDAILAHKMLHDLLFENLDVPNLRYRSGWSDERVASETKLALGVVVGFRKEHFFELTQDSLGARVATATTRLAERIAVLEKALAAMGAARATFEQAETLARKNATEIGRLIADLAAGAKE